MRKICLFISAVFLFAVSGGDAFAAIQIKKADSVASTTQNNSSATGASLVPTALGLVSGVMSLNKQQDALTAQCEPTTSEINFVNGIVKEWAMTGKMTADEAARSLNRERCQSAEGYALNEQMRASGMKSCVNWFNGTADRKAVWYQFPKVGKATVCKAGANCATAQDKQVVSDIYEIFDLVDFGPDDYLLAEATTAAQLLEKAERCAPSKISAKKQELWGDFLLKTAGGLGQKQNTGNIMESVGQVVGGGGGMSGIAGIASQFLQ